MDKTSFTRLPSKREYVINIGRLLIADHGKLAFYTPKQIETAHSKSDWYKALPKSQYGIRGTEFLQKLSLSAYECALSVFSSYADFHTQMARMGQKSQYTEKRKSVFIELYPEVAFESFEFLAANVDASWLELGEGIGALAEGVGHVFGSIFEVIAGALN